MYLLICVMFITCDLRRTIAQYRWGVFEQEYVDLCSNNRCGPRIHTMCYLDLPASNCRSYQPLKLSDSNIQSFIMGHNGLRNKVATNFNRPGSNIQYLHWDHDLQTMAEKWLQQCLIQRDPCHYICIEANMNICKGGFELIFFSDNSSYSVGQNIYYHSQPIPKNWEALAIRQWFNESRSMKNISIGGLKQQDVSNYTQMMWASTQFVGCGAAKMFDGYMVVCNYYPKGNIIGRPVYSRGPPCTQCPEERASCSRVFRGLCGIDDKYSTGSIPSVVILTFILLTITSTIQAHSLFGHN